MLHRIIETIEVGLRQRIKKSLVLLIIAPVDNYPNPAYVFPINGPDDCCEADITAILSSTKTGHKLSSTKDFNIYYDLDRDIRPYLKTAK